MSMTADERAQFDRDLLDKAKELVRVLELEVSGVRDGDGLWHGSDCVAHCIHEAQELLERYARCRKAGITHVIVGGSDAA